MAVLTFVYFCVSVFDFALLKKQNEMAYSKMAPSLQKGESYVRIQVQYNKNCANTYLNVGKQQKIT